MKKKVLVVLAIALILMLIPIKSHLKDGGTVEYRAVLYKVSKIHSMTVNENQKGYNVGTVIEIFGFEIYNNVEFSTDSH